MDAAVSTSARATTAGEARYRLDYPLAPARAPRVIALDRGADAIVRRVAALPWDSARFYLSTGAPTSDGNGGDPDDLWLKEAAGLDARLSDVLAGVDAVIMVATNDEGASTAALVGAACTDRAIMSAGIIVGEHVVDRTVAALRPHARILLVSEDQGDLDALLLAVRA
jgi:hypothetical protein